MSDDKYRVEHDSIGEKKLPKEANYGSQTLRAFENFSITGDRIDDEFVNNIVLVKKAAAITNNHIGLLNDELTHAMIKACDYILDGHHEDFIVDPIEGGAGTSLNMNANEVIANLAIAILGGEKGNYDLVNPYEHVNMAQSTNDVIPTAAKMTTIVYLNDLENHLKRLSDTLLIKAKEFDDVIKMGRTQMQDAVPIRLGQEFKAYATRFTKASKRVDEAILVMREVNIGGSAIGTSINVSEDYLKEIVPNINSLSGLDLYQASDLIESTSGLDDFVIVSGVLKSIATALSKMAGDLMLMSSGPRTGFHEINLPAKQHGSSIMPGKINPVIPEVVNQVAFDVIGKDMTIALAAHAGQLELNAFAPIAYYSLFQSIKRMNNAIDTLIDNCLIDITANKERCFDEVGESLGVVTILAPILGYEKASMMVKKALKEERPIKEIILQEHPMSEEELDELLNPLKMTEIGRK